MWISRNKIDSLNNTIDTLLKKVSDLELTIRRLRLPFIDTTRFSPPIERAKYLLSDVIQERSWIMTKIHAWQQTDERELMIIGLPGSGKTVIAAQLMTDPSFNVGAGHFFNVDIPATLDMKLMLYSIATQLAEVIPGLRERLDEVELERLAGQSSLAHVALYLLIDPCAGLTVEKPIVIVLDGIDNLPSLDRRDLFGVIGGTMLPSFSDIPEWMRFIVTSRRFDNIGGGSDIDIDENVAENNNDIRAFISGSCCTQDELEALVDQASGSFLHARILCKHIKRGKIMPIIPPHAYVSMLKRFKTEFGSKSTTVINALVRAQEQGVDATLNTLASLVDMKPNKFKSDVESFLDVRGDGRVTLPHPYLYTFVRDMDVITRYYLKM